MFVLKNRKFNIAGNHAEHIFAINVLLCILCRVVPVNHSFTLTWGEERKELISLAGHIN